MVLRTAEAVEPLRDGTVPLRAVGTRDLAVRDVANERVRERELALVFKGGAPLAADEALALERVQ